MSYDRKPARMNVVNLATGKSLEVQFNPTELEESTGANFAKLTVPGLSHQRKHFVNTDDDKFTLALFNHCVGLGPEARRRILDARGFLKAAVHPRRGADGEDRDGPPRMLLVWPGFVSVQCRLMSPLTFRYTQFALDGSPIAYTASCVFEEQRDAFVGMEDILADMGGE